MKAREIGRVGRRFQGEFCIYMLFLYIVDDAVYPGDLLVPAAVGLIGVLHRVHSPAFRRYRPKISETIETLPLHAQAAETPPGPSTAAYCVPVSPALL
ncbi:MAG: hypothetical protein JW885_03995 [Deltaproteobacteria bacterium]|nr:hypothetical protein [Candidatus Zymogenaceae bacterium]